MENRQRQRDRSHSGSSDSWSLVDVDDDDISLSSASSIHDDLSDHGTDHSGDESSESDEEELGFSTEQPTDESMVALEGPKTEATQTETPSDHSLLEKPDEDEAMDESHSLDDADELETEESEVSDGDESDFSDESDKEEEGNVQEAEADENMYIVEEAEILEDSAAKHYVEPTRVSKAFDSLCHSWMCLQVPGTMEPTFQCFGSEKEAVAYSSAGLQYRNLELDQLHLDPEYAHWNSPNAHPEEPEKASVEENEPETLSQCKRDLEEAKAELNAKAAMNRYIRQHAKLREEQVKKEMFTKVNEVDKMTKSQKNQKDLQNVHINEQSPQEDPPVIHEVEPTTSKTTEKNQPYQTDSICHITENAFKNFTQSIYQRLRSWTNSTALMAIATIQPEIVQSFEQISKISSWLQTSSIFDLPFESLTPNPDFISSIPKIMKVAQTQVKSVANKITTALTTQNFSSISSMVSNYKKHPIIRSLQKRVESALITLGKWSKEPSVCFRNRACDKVRKLANFLKDHAHFGRIVGPRNSEIYFNYLSSLSGNQCQTKSHQMRCEQCWWTGSCPMQKCLFQQWQKQYKLRPQKFVLRNPKMMELFQELEWATSSLIRPCPEDEQLHICDYNTPSEMKPCQSSRYVNKSNKPSSQAPVRPSGDGRPKAQEGKKVVKEEVREEKDKASFSGWLLNRDKLRAEYRLRQDRAAQEKAFWMFQRSRLREEMRKNTTLDTKTSKIHERIGKKANINENKSEKRRSKPNFPTFYTESHAKFPTFEDGDTNWLWDRSRKRAELRKEEINGEKTNSRREARRNDNWMFRRSQQRAEMRMKERRR